MEVCKTNGALVIIGNLFVSVETPNGVFRYEWGAYTKIKKQILPNGRFRFTTGE